MDIFDLIIAVAWLLRFVSRTAVRGLANAYAAAAARGWLTTPALIQAVTALPETPAGVRIDYEYAVNGTYYGGVRTVECFTKARAEAFRAGYVCRSTYMVYYDPHNAARSWLPNVPVLVG